MTWTSDCGTVRLFCGDCLDVLPTLEAGSVDAVVTDPPYGLSFMGKHWDHGIPGEQFWREVIRVAKPGCHLLAFGGTRTYHRLACAIEDAGWEVRDCLGWIYGSGFPKSLDVSKAIDKRGGVHAEFAEFRDAVKEAMKRNNVGRAQLQDALGNFMLSHYLTAGSQPAVPNLRDYRIIRDIVGLGDEWDHLFDDEAKREVVGQGTSAISTRKELKNNKGTVWGADSSTFNITAPATDAAKQWQGWGTALKPAWEPIILARKPLVGTVAANVLEYGAGGLNVDGCRVPTPDGKPAWHYPNGPGGNVAQEIFSGLNSIRTEYTAPASGRWPANIAHDGSGEVLDVLGEQSRFFYSAKASKADRDDENHHPTVKPTDLMRWLVRLVTPPGGMVLDPFMGSGSTGKAARLEGFRFVGIERESEYHEIAKRRIEGELKRFPLLERAEGPKQGELFQ